LGLIEQFGEIPSRFLMVDDLIKECKHSMVIDLQILYIVHLLEKVKGFKFILLYLRKHPINLSIGVLDLDFKITLRR